MKKTLKIFFPLLVIVGVLLSMLVPVSASSSGQVIYSYDPAYDLINKRSANSNFHYVSSLGGEQDNYRSCLSVVQDNDNDYTYLRSNAISGNSSIFAVSFSFQSDVYLQISSRYGGKQYTVFEYFPTDNAYSSIDRVHTSLVGTLHTVLFVVDLVSGYINISVDGLVDRYVLDDYSFLSYNYQWPFYAYIEWSAIHGNSACSFYDFMILDIDFDEDVYLGDYLYFAGQIIDAYWSGYSGSVNHSYLLQSDTYQAGYAAGEAVHANDYQNGASDGFSSGQQYGEQLHASDYQNGVDAGYVAGYDEAIAAHENDYSSGYAAGKRNGEALHANDFENGYNAGIIADTNVVTDTVDGVFDGLLSTLGILNGFSIFGITLGGILSIAAIFLVLFFIFKVIRK